MSSASKSQGAHRKRKKGKGFRKNVPSAEAISKRYFEVLQLRQRVLEVEGSRVAR